MVVQVEAGGVEITVVLYHQDGVFAVVFAQVLSAAVVVEAQHVAVEPHLPSA